jgi:hypothetical protein
VADDIRIFDSSGQPAVRSEAQQELIDAIRNSGNPALLGNWTEQIIPKSTAGVIDSTGSQAAKPDGKITLDVREYLDAFDARSLYDLIAAFKADIDAVGTSEEIHELLHSLLFPPGLRSAVLPFSTVTVPALRAPLYRVRPNISDPSEVKTVGGVWARPDGGTPGRVNRAGQRILYLAADTAHLAMLEAKPKDGDYLAVSQFVATDKIMLIQVRHMAPGTKLSVRQQRKLSALAEFFNWVFNYSGTDPENPRYDAAQIIALDFRLLPVEVMGWGYQSVLFDTPFAYNIALDADRAKGVLRLVNTQIYHYKAGAEPQILRHTSLVPEEPNVEPGTRLVPGKPVAFEWRPPRQPR